MLLELKENEAQEDRPWWGGSKFRLLRKSLWEDIWERTWRMWGNVSHGDSWGKASGKAGNTQDPPGASSESRRVVCLEQKVQLRSRRGAWPEPWAFQVRILAFTLNKMRTQEGFRVEEWPLDLTRKSPWWLQREQITGRQKQEKKRPVRYWNRPWRRRCCLPKKMCSEVDVFWN